MISETASKVARATVLICGVQMLCCPLDSLHEASAAEAFNIYDVAVYLERDAPCTATAVKSVTVTVSPFKPQADLGDLVAELARKAAEAGANVVYAMKLISFIPDQGAVATAMVATCPQPNPPPSGTLPRFDPELADIVKRASNVRAYRFADRSPALRRTVQASERVPETIGGDNAIGRLRQLIFAADTYKPATSVVKPCIFVASFGFEFSEGNSSAWWLVSDTPGCESAVLVSRNKSWSDADIFDLPPAAAAAFGQLLQAPKK